MPHRLPQLSLTATRAAGPRLGGLRLGRRRHCVLWLVAILTLGPGSTAAAAELPDSLIAEAKRQYAAQEYERVIRLVGPVTQSTTATDQQRVDAYELLGLSQLILGNAASAREVFEKLLRLDPQHVLRDPSESPKLRRFFESVRQSLAPALTTPVLEEVEPPDRPRAGRSATFTARASRGADQVRWVVLHHRAAGQRSYSTVTMARDGEGRYATRLRLPVSGASYELSYYLEARDRTGAQVASAGAADQPLTLRVRGTPSGGGKTTATPLYRRWWFWTLVGAAVAGGTVGVIIATRERAPEGNLPPHQIQLPLAQF